MRSLQKQCVVIESHGPTYHGIEQIEKWFKLWIEAKSAVLKWEISSFYFCEKDQTAFFEWDFVYISDNSPHSILGISVVKFLNKKINFIHEYRMVKPEFIWEGKQLISE